MPDFRNGPGLLPSPARAGSFTRELVSSIFYLAGLFFALSLSAFNVVTAAQEQSAQTLAEHSSIVVRGKVIKLESSEEPLLPGSQRTAVISIEQTYAGAEIVGEQKGRTATVILSRPGAVKAGQEAVFFGNPRYLGRSVTIADEGEVPANEATPETMQTALQHGLQARRDRAVLDRLATASIVFVGMVEEIQAVETSKEKGIHRQLSEHDPEWNAAKVRISRPIRGGAADETVTLMFAASRDVMWFNSPKLKPGQQSIFMAQALNRENADANRASALLPLLQRESVYVVIEPFDVLPVADEGHFRELLSTAKESQR